MIGPVNLATRFWRRVNKSGPTECWLWKGTVDGCGYGMLSKYQQPGKWHKAHRLSWELHHGPIPAGLSVLHHCDTPRCVNPLHLYLGTQQDNVRDRARRRRGKEHRQHGEANDNAKLTEADVRTILTCLKAGQSQTAIARQFGINQPQVSRIFLKQSWRHLWED